MRRRRREEEEPQEWKGDARKERRGSKSEDDGLCREKRAQCCQAL
jgi:hypothetical protein